MIPIELPLMAGAPETPAWASKFNGGETCLSTDTAQSGLLNILKESFAAALDEVTSQQTMLAQCDGELPLEQGPLGEGSLKIPEALTMLVTFLKTTKEQVLPDDEALSQLTETDIAILEEQLAALGGLAWPNAPSDKTAAEESMPLIDSALLKRDDRALRQWIATMGVTDEKIQTRALERWLKMQQTGQSRESMPDVKPAATALIQASLQPPDLQTTDGTMPAVPSSEEDGGSDKAPIVLQPLSGKQAAGVAKVTSQTHLPAEKGLTVDAAEAPVKATLAAKEVAREPDKMAEAKKPLVDTKSPGVDLNRFPEAGNKQAPAQRAHTDPQGTQNSELLTGWLKGNGKDQTTHTNAHAPSQFSGDRPAENIPGEAPALVLQMSDQKEKTLVSHPGVMASKELAGGENTSERGTTTTDPILDQTPLGKSAANGQMRSAVARPPDIHAFMRQHAPEVMTQIVDKAVFQVRNGHKEMKIALKPSFLGHMHMRIVTDNQQVTIRIMTESPVIKEAIENHLYQLKADLGHHGLSVDRVDVFVASDSHQHEQRDASNPQREGPLGREDRQAKNESRQERGSQGQRSGQHVHRQHPGSIDYFA